MTEVPNSAHRCPVKVEVLGADVKSDDIATAHTGEQHEREAAGVEQSGGLSVLQPVDRQSADRDHDRDSDEHNDCEGTATAVVQPHCGRDSHDRQQQRPQPTSTSNQVGHSEFISGRRST